MQVFEKFVQFMADEFDDHRKMWELDANTLNNYICNFLINAKRMDGTPYEPDTLTSMMRALDR